MPRRSLLMRRPRCRAWGHLDPTARRASPPWSEGIVHFPPAAGALVRVNSIAPQLTFSPPVPISHVRKVDHQLVCFSTLQRRMQSLYLTTMSAIDTTLHHSLAQEQESSHCDE